MLKALLARARQGHRTLKYPAGPPVELPARFRGLPVLDQTKCPEGCEACVDSCPTVAIARGEELTLDLGRCLLCTECTRACPTGAIELTKDARLAVRQREHLRLRSGAELERAHALEGELMQLFGRSLKLRQVSAGGCNACEADCNVLGTVVWDMGRFGIQFVASPRHADGLLITGPVTENMRLALQKTYAALPDPKLVIAVGACAISGGPFLESDAQHGGADGTVPVDLYVPGCPPHPLTILDGLLRLLGRVQS